MSLNLGQGHKALLNCGALWWTQQPAGAEHCRDLTRSLINDCILLLPPTDNPMPLIPSKSPLLAGILLTYFSDIYPLPEMNRSFVAPPVELVRIAFCWLKDNPELTGAQPSETQGVVPMLGRIYQPEICLLYRLIKEPFLCAYLIFTLNWFRILNQTHAIIPSYKKTPTSLNQQIYTPSI